MFYKKRSYIYIVLVLVIALGLVSCVSKKRSYIEISAEQGNFERFLVTGKSKERKPLRYSTYSVVREKASSKVETGRVDLPGRLIYTGRKVFSIFDDDQFLTDGELIFLYTREGFDTSVFASANFYGRTGQSDFPFTISLVSDPKTHILYGKAKRLEYVLDIEGNAYLKQGFKTHSTETGFSIKYQDKLIGLVSLFGEKSIFVKPDLTFELERSIMYVAAFLLEYERYYKFPINRNLIKGES